MKKLFLLVLFSFLIFPTQCLAERTYIRNYQKDEEQKTGLSFDKKDIYLALKANWAVVNAKINTKNTTSGTSSPRNSFDKSVLGGALALGYDFEKNSNYPIRIELEYTFYGATNNHYRTNSTDYTSYHTDISTLFFNCYYDFHTETLVTPYLGGGIGMAMLALEGESTSSGVTSSFEKKSETNFTWNIGFGVSYEISETVKLDLAYRYVHFQDIQSKKLDTSRLESKSRAQQIMFAIRWDYLRFL